MATLFQMDSDLINASTEKIVKHYLTYDYLSPLLPQIVEYYEQELPLWRVLNYYGIDNVDADTVQAYVHCKLASHGTRDSRPSAGYYKIDNTTGKERPAVFCYKCSKLLTSFWYLYDMEKSYNELSIKDLFLFIWETFKIPFPTNILGNFDLDAYIESGGKVLKTENKVDYSVMIPYMDSVRQLKKTDPELFIKSLNEVWKPQVTKEIDVEI